METTDKVKQAIAIIKATSAMHNFALAYSSGKDSVILDYLCREANVKVERFHNVTTIDPPGTIPFAEKHRCTIVRPRFSFLDLVEKKGFPTMFRRFCCEKLKERYFADYVYFGIRANESTKRQKCYTEIEDMYYYSKKKFTNRFFPMLHFDNEDVEYLVNEKSLECHPLYYDKNGRFHVERRLGCIGCPLQSDRGFSEYLENKKLFIQVMKRGIKFHVAHGRTPEDAALNMIHNLFYIDKHEQYLSAFYGLFPLDPWEVLENKFGLNKNNFL